MDPNNNGSKPSANSSLSTWVDKSGKTPARSATVPATISPPIWNANTISLDGSTQLYITDNYIAAEPIETGFIVFTPSSTATQISAIIGTPSSTGRELRYDPTGKIELWIGNQHIFRQSTVNTAMVKGNTILYNYCYDKTTGVTSLHSSVNGTEISVLPNTASPSVLNSITGGVTEFGATGTSGLNWFNGTISEIMIFNTRLSITDRQAVEGYLAWKWGLNGSLPTTHPYSSNRLTMGGGSNILVPQKIYENNNKNKKNKNLLPPQTFMSGGGIILSPASYALEQ